MNSINYVMSPRSPSDADREKINRWLQSLHGHAAALFGLLSPDEDPYFRMYALNPRGTMDVHEMRAPDDQRHAFIEHLRDTFRAAEEMPEFAAFQGIVYRTPAPEDGSPRPETLMIHLETPDRLVAAMFSDIIRSPDAAPRLGPPEIQIYDEKGHLQGAMVGYFLPRPDPTSDQRPPDANLH